MATKHYQKMTPEEQTAVEARLAAAEEARPEAPETDATGIFDPGATSMAFGTIVLKPK
jgi:hypothetical protein